MAIEKMKLINISGSIDRLDDVTAACLDSGCFAPEQSFDMLKGSGYYRINEENPYNSYMQRITDAVAESGRSLDIISPDDNNLSKEEYESIIHEAETALYPLHEEKRSLISEAEQYKASAAQLKHFESLDVDLCDIWNVKYMKIRFGRLPCKSYEAAKTYSKNKFVEFFPCSEEDGYYWGMYAAPVAYVDEVDRIFASLFFQRLRIPDASGTPAQALADIESRLSDIEARIKEIDSQIEKDWNREYSKLSHVYSKLIGKAKAFELRKYAARKNEYFILFGWVPKSAEKKFVEKLSKIEDIEVNSDNAPKDASFEPPTKLKNSRIFRPYEYYVSMFGMPKYTEIDPTAFVALTYTLLYGIMFADLGQGIVLAIAGYIMGRFMNNKLGPILIRCGISGALFGVLFGSVFGYEHLLDGFYRMLGFKEKPIEVMDSKSINVILITAVGIGVILMFTAIIISIVTRLKQHDLENALFGTNGFAGFFLYSGIIMLILGIVVDLPVPTAVVISCFIVLPLILVWLKEPLGKLASREKNWMPESWGEYLVQGFFEVFESVLSYITNTVSFIRVGAFILVHAGMMLVFTTLSEMVGGGAAGIVVMIFGNALVIVLEGLLVGVQGMRLEYYEMFSRFFEGSGKEYKPAALSAPKNK